MYQSEDDLEDDLKTKPATTTRTINNNILDLDDDDLFTPSEEVSEEVCESFATITTTSDIDFNRVLVADGECHFDSTLGYSCVANPKMLPNMLGVPTGPIFRTWNGPSRGVC